MVHTINFSVAATLSFAATAALPEHFTGITTFLRILLHFYGSSYIFTDTFMGLATFYGINYIIKELAIFLRN